MKKYRPPKPIVLYRKPLTMVCERIARRVHSQDKRIISGRPYFDDHSLRVACHLQRLRFSEIDVAAGLIHDCVEDHRETCSFEDVAAELKKPGIGERKIAAVILRVKALTYDDTYLTRKEQHERRLEAINQRPEAIPIALADTFDNASDIVANLRSGISVFGPNYLNCDPRETIENWLGIAALGISLNYSDHRIMTLSKGIVFSIETIKHLLDARRK